MPTEVAPAVSVVVGGLKVISEMNRREHWTKTHKRKKEQQDSVLYTLRQRIAQRPWGRYSKTTLRVVMTRLIGKGGRQFDTDNLTSAFKHVRDAVAWWLSRQDSPTSGIEWVTEQERAADGRHGVRIEVYEVA